MVKIPGRGSGPRPAVLSPSSSPPAPTPRPGDGAALCLLCFPADSRQWLGCKLGDASQSTLVNLSNYLLKHPARSPSHCVCSHPPARCVITAESIGTTSITSLRFRTPAQGLYLGVWSIAYIFNLSIISQDLGLSAAEVLCSMEKVKSLKQGHVYGLS